MARTKASSKLTYRPKSYWEHSDPLQAILAGISGRARREMITDYWNAGKIDELDPALLVDDLSEESRRSLGRIHPFFMGGEYLPERLPGEVTIVTIQLESTTFDVIELRARPLPDGRIGLRWVDEYETGFVAPCGSVDQPMTFQELIAYIENSATDEDCAYNLPVAYVASNCEFYAGDRAGIEGLRDFATFSSDFYPDLAAWAKRKIDEWVDRFIAETCGGEEREEGEEGEES